jgi:hypothetical protein
VREKFRFKDIVFPVDYPVTKDDRPLINTPSNIDIALFEKIIPRVGRDYFRIFLGMKETILKYARKGLANDKVMHPKSKELFKKY